MRYSGDALVWAPSAASAAAPVTLSATVRAGRLAADGTADVRSARVTFVDRGSGVRLCGPLVPVPVAGDPGIGTVRCRVRLRAPAPVGAIYTVGTVVGGGYARDQSADDAVITVARPQAPGIAAGAGYLVETRPAGREAPASGSTAGFGLALTDRGESPRGTARIIVRGHGRTYQVTAGAVASVAAAPAAAGRPGTAQLRGRASIEDITNPAAPVLVDRGAAICVAMTDGGSPSRDGIALTTWNHSGALWFSSNWNGTVTEQQRPGGGDLTVR